MLGHPTRESAFNIATQIPKTYIYPHLLCFFNNHIGIWKRIFGHQVKLTYKVRKSVFIIEMYFKQFFTCLERTSTFITSIFRTTYRSSFPEGFSIKGVLLQICSVFTEEYLRIRIRIKKCDFNTFEVTLLHGYSPVNCLNYSYIFLEMHHWVTASVYTKVNAAYACWHSPNQS